MRDNIRNRLTAIGCKEFSHPRGSAHIRHADTNIFLRPWLDDDPGQNNRIDLLLAEHGHAIGSLLVTDVVLAEAIWTLKSAFDQDKHAQPMALRGLLDESPLRIRKSRNCHGACIPV